MTLEELLEAFIERYLFARVYAKQRANINVVDKAKATIAKV